MAMMVPGERRNAIPSRDAQMCQRCGKLFRSFDHVRVSVPMNSLVESPAHNLNVAIERLRSSQEGGNRELIVHHEAAHWFSTVDRLGTKSTRNHRQTM